MVVLYYPSWYTLVPPHPGYTTHRTSARPLTTSSVTWTKSGRGALNEISSLLPDVWIDFETDYLTFGPQFSRSPQYSTTPASAVPTFVYPIY